MNDKQVLLVATVGSLVVGTLAGYLVTGRSDSAATPPVAAPAPAGQAADQCADCSLRRQEMEARLAANPKDAAALMELGICELEMDQMAAGQQHLKEAVACATEPRILVQSGNILAQLGLMNEAGTAFDKALAADPDDSSALFYAGLLAYTSMRETTAVQRHWTRYLKVAPNAPEAGDVRQILEQLSQRNPQK